MIKSIHEISNGSIVQFGHGEVAEVISNGYPAEIKWWGQEGDDAYTAIIDWDAMILVPSLGWSKFAKHRHRKGMGFSYFDGTDGELFNLIRENWDKREIGDGAESIDDVCLAPVPPEKFVCTTTKITDDTQLQARVTRRQPHEHPFAKVEALNGDPEPCNYAKVVLYAAHELLKNGGERSCEADWEIICIIASPIEKEPMHPLACARNMLRKPGGTPRSYSARELANSIWYWSQRCSIAAQEGS